ncbi:MAG TPA: hypothetical protein VGC80_11110 [Acetobacteraceae bacterium]|jgi:hypothetical protein
MAQSKIETKEVQGATGDVDKAAEKTSKGTAGATQSSTPAPGVSQSSRPDDRAENRKK